MKKFFWVVLVALFAVSCGLMYGKTDPKTAAKVEKAVKAHTLTIDITQIFPSQGPVQTTAGEYSFKISGNKVDTHLPFIGESTGGSAFGTADVGINFENCQVEIKDDFKKASKGEWVLSFTAQSGDDDVRVRIIVWDNGSASISCNPVNKSPMSYKGELVLD